MSIKGFRIFNNELQCYEPRCVPEDWEFHTGTYDRHGNPIYEGDMLRSKSCEIPFKVENIVDFLMMCGEYRAKNGVDIFDSLEIVNE